MSCVERFTSMIWGEKSRPGCGRPLTETELTQVGGECDGGVVLPDGIGVMDAGVGGPVAGDDDDVGQCVSGWRNRDSREEVEFGRVDLTV